MGEPGAGEREQRLGDRLEPRRHLLLVGGAGERRLADERGDGVDVAGHAAAEHSLRLERLVVGQAGLAVIVAHPRGPEVLVAVDALVGSRHREPERPSLGLEELEVEPALLGDLARRVARLGRQQALHGQQREPLLRDRAAQLLERHAVGVQPLEQRDPRLACLGVAAFEETFRFPVHRRAGRYSPAPCRSAAGSRDGSSP